jgi:LysM repeat protein
LKRISGFKFSEVFVTSRNPLRKSFHSVMPDTFSGTETTENQMAIHTVQSGDTLWKIAQKYGTTIQAIVDANKLDPNKYLYVGQKLTIPTK